MAQSKNLPAKIGENVSEGGARGEQCFAGPTRVPWLVSCEAFVTFRYTLRSLPRPADDNKVNKKVWSCTIGQEGRERGGGETTTANQRK